MRTEWGHGPVNQCPVTVNSPRQERRVFVIGRHDDPIPLEAAKVFGDSQGDSRAATRVRRVSDYILLQFRYKRDAGILDAPDFFWIVLGTGHQRRFSVDLPTIHAVSRTGGTKV